MLGSKNILKAALPPFPPAGLCLFLLFFPFVFPLFSPFLWRCDCPTRRAQNSPFPTEISTRGHALFPHPQKEKKPKRNLTQHLQTPILQRKKQRETPRWLKHRPGREEPRGTSSKTWSPPSSNPPPPPQTPLFGFCKEGQKKGSGDPELGSGCGSGPGCNTPARPAGGAPVQGGGGGAPARPGPRGAAHRLGPNDSSLVIICNHRA